jgi:hypothetical protein
MSRSRETDRRLGWLAAGLLFLISSSAWALDLNREIQSRNLDSVQLASTLGHGLRVNEHTSNSTARQVHVAFFKRYKRHHR